MSQVSCSIRLKFRVLPLFEDIETHRVHHPNSLNSYVPSFVFYLFLKTLNAQFLCLQFGVLPLLKTLNAQGPPSKFTQFLCFKFGVLPLFEDIEHTGSIIQTLSIPMSQLSCSTSFEDIEYSIPGSPVWCFYLF